MSDVIRVDVGKQGRVVIPAAFRRKLGIGEGTTLAVRIKGETIEMMTPEAAGRRLQAMFADVPISSTELMAERRAEALRDAQEELSELERRARRS